MLFLIVRRVNMCKHRLREIQKTKLPFVISVQMLMLLSVNTCHVAGVSSSNIPSAFTLFFSCWTASGQSKTFAADCDFNLLTLYFGSCSDARACWEAQSHIWVDGPPRRQFTVDIQWPRKPKVSESNDLEMRQLFLYPQTTFSMRTKHFWPACFHFWCHYFRLDSHSDKEGPILCHFFKCMGV